MRNRQRASSGTRLTAYDILLATTAAPPVLTAEDLTRRAREERQVDLMLVAFRAMIRSRYGSVVEGIAVERWCGGSPNVPRALQGKVRRAVVELRRGERSLSDEDAVADLRAIREAVSVASERPPIAANSIQNFHRRKTA